MYKESNSWQSTWFVPHDVQGLINLMGGREAFVKRLNEFFTLPYEPKGVARNVTRMIGQYCHGNEPDHHAPFLYNWAGVPWKTMLIRAKWLPTFRRQPDGIHLLWGAGIAAEVLLYAFAIAHVTEQKTSVVLPAEFCRPRRL